MYMRFVHVNVKPESMPDLRRLYDERIIPILRRVPGCLHASLIQSVEHPDECISMTLWETRHQAEEYEAGEFQRLLRDAQPYLSDSSEWNIHLTSDLTLKAETVSHEPEVDSYLVSSQKNEQFLSHQEPLGLYVRVVSPQVRTGMVDEFRRLYVDEVLPQLRAVNGCRYAAVIENAQRPDGIISISIWSSKADADAYESSGIFDELTDKVRHTFSEIYQWKMQLQRETGRQVVTSEEMTVAGYSVVTGKSFF